MSHHRSASLLDDKQQRKKFHLQRSDGSINTVQKKREEPEGRFHCALEVGKGVGKGVYGRTVTATGKRISGFKDMVHNGIFGNVNCSKPGEPRYPRYRACYSVKSVHEVVPLASISIENAPSISLIIGPDDGFKECISDMSERKRYLKTQLKLLQQNPGAVTDPDSLSINELNPEEIKKKQTHLRNLEKKVKRFASHIDALHNSMDPRIYGRTIATYAYDCIKNERAGEPNADSFYAEGFKDLLFFGVADGIGWGVPSRRASQGAMLGFMMALSEFQSKRRGYQLDTVGMAQACFSAIEMAHLSVYCNTEAKTTICGGMIVELEHQPSAQREEIPFSTMDDSDSDSGSEFDEDMKKRWVFVGVSVGDTLIYRYSATTMEVMELTVSDRTGGVRDAGGCLGGKEPDLKNLTFHYCLADEGDIFIAVSDGVHDNLDPEVLKCSPQEAGYIGEETNWREVDSEQKNDLKRRFKEERLLEIIENIDDVTPRTVTAAVLDEITEVTRLQREGYEQGSRLQKDWDKMSEQERTDLNAWVKETLKTSKGKFDHVTCLCVQVGNQ